MLTNVFDKNVNCLISNCVKLAEIIRAFIDIEFVAILNNQEDLGLDYVVAN